MDVVTDIHGTITQVSNTLKIVGANLSLANEVATFMLRKDRS